jgi:hypothetical protein
MGKTVTIEGILLIILGAVGVAEAVRLIIQKASLTVQDILGPGPYVLVVSIPLIVIGIVHLISHRLTPSIEKVTVNKEMQRRMMIMIGACAFYTFLMSYIGYLLATLFFFFIQFKAVGIKSWRTNILLTLSLTTAYYIVFVKYCNMVFPRGILSNIF